MRNLFKTSIIAGVILASSSLFANAASVDELYEEFDNAMRDYISSGAPYVLIKQKYNRLSNEYFKRCNIEFDKDPQCKKFQESFFHWYYNVGGQRTCRFRTCGTH